MVGRSLSSRQLFERKKNRRTSRRGDDAKSKPVAAGPRRLRRPRMRSSANLIWNFLLLLRGQRGLVISALATLTVGSILALAPPAATKFIIDYVLTNEPLPAWITNRVPLPQDRWQLLVLVCGVVAAVAFAKVGVQLFSGWRAMLAMKRMQFSVRRRVFEQAVRLPLNRVQELKSGGVPSILRADAGSVGELIFALLYNPWQAIVQLFGSLCVLAWVDWRLVVGTTVLLPVFFFTHRLWINRLRPKYREIRARREDLDAQTTEAFGGMKVVRGFNRQRREASRFMRGNHLMGRHELHVWWMERTIDTIWELLIPLGTTGLLLYGGWQILSGHLTLGDLMMFLTYLLMLLQPMSVLSRSATRFQNGLSALDRILDLLEEPRELEATSSTVTVRKKQAAGDVRFENVYFRYPGGKQLALIDISLDVKAGQTIALVGPSGAGKTSFCNLVARFYDPTDGRICLDGRDLREITVDSYRSLLGIVEQDVFLFDGTIAENIAYAARTASHDEIVNAATVANAHPFICHLPDGYETFIGERGVKLSGGQRQRIAIARAVLADPRILILDEATSNLDTESERLIQQSLAVLTENRTCFVIAHRLSTIVHADRIVVLENGQITQLGTHHELMATDGKYREMVEVQFQNGKAKSKSPELAHR